MNTSLKTLLTVSSLGMAMAVTPALAQTQTTPPASTPPATSAAPATNAAPSASTSANISGSSLEASGAWRASKLMGLDVYNSQNEKLGDINELILDKDGKVSAVIIGVGGFLGVGARDIAVSLNDLKFVEEPRPAATASNTASPRPATAPANAPAANPRDSMASSTPAATTKAAYDWVPDHALLNATKEQLNTMAEFQYTAK